MTDKQLQEIQRGIEMLQWKSDHGYDEGQVAASWALEHLTTLLAEVEQLRKEQAYSDGLIVDSPAQMMGRELSEMPVEMLLPYEARAEVERLRQRVKELETTLQHDSEQDRNEKPSW